MGKHRKKKTPEERAAERAHGEDLDRRLREMIERYRVLSETAMRRRRKKTPEERAAQRAHSEDLDRRLREMIERYRALIEERRTAESQ